MCEADSCNDPDAAGKGDGHRDVPLIMVTSKGEHLDRVRGFDAGVDEYMTKPLDSGELVRVVERHIGRQHGRRDA